MQQAAGATLPPLPQQLPGRRSSGEACPRAPPPSGCSPLPSTDAARVAAALSRPQQELQQEAAQSLQACAINATAGAAAPEAGDGGPASPPLASISQLYLAYDRRHTNAFFDGAQGGSGWGADGGATHIVLRTATAGSAGSASDEQELLPGLAGRSSSRGELEVMTVHANTAFRSGA